MSEENPFRRTSKAPMLLRMFVVYKSPKDYPGRFVLRGWRIEPGQAIPDAEPILITTSLPEVHKFLKTRRMYQLPKNRNDDPVILETWI